jgi:hypothetical protein
MSELKFNDDSEEFAMPQPQAEEIIKNSGSGLTALLMKWGVVSNPQQAQYAMVGIIIFFLILTVISYRTLM